MQCVNFSAPAKRNGTTDRQSLAVGILILADLTKIISDHCLTGPICYTHTWIHVSVVLMPNPVQYIKETIYMTLLITNNTMFDCITNHTLRNINAFSNWTI